MSCTPDRVKDFFFGELSESERSGVRAHLDECAECREELDRLRLTQAALQALPAEEPPRRIGFVSDKVFEPRWWQRVWASGPRLGFASALVLAAAIVVHAAWRPAAPAAIDEAAIQARVAAEVARRIEPAVQAAVAAAEERQARKAAELVEAARKDLEFQRQADRVQFQQSFEYLVKKYGVLYNIAAKTEGSRP